jgi:acyl carrier protein
MALTKEKLIEFVKSEVQDIDLVNEGNFDLPFADIGIDSMDMLSILLKVEEYSGKEIPDQDTEKLTTLNSILTYCNK